MAFKDSWIKGPNAIWTVSFKHLSSLYEPDALILGFTHNSGHGHWCTPDSSPSSIWSEREKDLPFFILIGF